MWKTGPNLGFFNRYLATTGGKIVDLEDPLYRSGRWGKNWIMLQKRYASVFALYDIVNMDDIFGWHGKFIKSCSIRNDSHLVIYIIWKRMPPRNV